MAQPVLDMDSRAKVKMRRKGIRLRRDTWVSVMYFEELNSGESSATF